MIQKKYHSSDIFLGYTEVCPGKKVFTREDRKNSSYSSDEVIELINNTSVLCPDIKTEESGVSLNAKIAWALGIKLPKREIILSGITEKQQLDKALFSTNYLVKNASEVFSVPYYSELILDELAPFKKEILALSKPPIKNSVGIDNSRIISATMKEFKGRFFPRESPSLSRGALTFQYNSIQYLAIFHQDELFIAVNNFKFGEIKSLFGQYFSGKIFRSKLFPVCYVKIENTSKSLEILLDKTTLQYSSYKFLYKNYLTLTNSILFFNDLVISKDLQKNDLFVKDVLLHTPQNYINTNFKRKNLKVMTNKVCFPIVYENIDLKSLSVMDPNTAFTDIVLKIIDIIYNIFQKDTRFFLYSKHETNYFQESIPFFIGDTVLRNLSDIKKAKNYTKFVEILDKDLHRVINLHQERVINLQQEEDDPKFDLFNQIITTVITSSIFSNWPLSNSQILSISSITIDCIIRETVGKARVNSSSGASLVTSSISYDKFSNLFANDPITNSSPAVQLKPGRTVENLSIVSMVEREISQTRPIVKVSNWSSLNGVPVTGLIGSGIKIKFRELEYEYFER